MWKMRIKPWNALYCLSFCDEFSETGKHSSAMLHLNNCVNMTGYENTKKY
jgi:hypothetical protein